MTFSSEDNLGTGTITFAGGTLQWASGDTDISDRINEIDEGVNAIIDTNGNDVEFGYALTGDGGLTKNGTGTLTLSAKNTYSGGTTISDGILTFSDGDNLGSGTITFNGGTLRWASGYAGYFRSDQ